MEIVTMVLIIIKRKKKKSFLKIKNKMEQVLKKQLMKKQLIQKLRQMAKKNPEMV